MILLFSGVTVWGGFLGCGVYDLGASGVSCTLLGFGGLLILANCQFVGF